MMDDYYPRWFPIRRSSKSIRPEMLNAWHENIQERIRRQANELRALGLSVPEDDDADGSDEAA
jgi:hypothetical protein